MDRLASMAAFVQVVETGSFAAAANVLGISAPMVGKHIRFLEERMGVSLINRTTRRQNLTEAGKAYYEQCRSILADVAAAETTAAEHLSAPRGRLRVTMPTLLGRYCIAPLLLEMAAGLPDLKLELAFTDDLVDLGDYDLAIRSLSEHRSEVPGGAGLATRRLSIHAMLVCCAPSYLARCGSPSASAELANHTALAFGRHGRRQPWTFTTTAGTLATIEPPGRIVMDDLEAIADAAAAGLGLAWLPSWLVRSRISSGQLVELHLDGPGLGYNNYALWHEGILTPKIRVALDVLAGKLQPLM
ncbi:LysR family transcriptional regulator [Rhizobium jaguaris]